MFKEKQWRVTANIELLLNDVHPPARIEREFISSELSKVVSTHNFKAPTNSTQSGPLVDARSVVSFKKMTYCSTQDIKSPVVQRILVRYYQHLLHRIFLWSSPFLYQTAPGKGAVDDDPTRGPSAPSPLKNEESGEATAPYVPIAKLEKKDGEAEEERGGREEEGGEGFEGRRAYRAVGILTQAHDVVGAQALQPWEFFVIADVDDVAAYAPALRALQRDGPGRAGREGEGGGRGRRPVEAPTGGAGPTADLPSLRWGEDEDEEEGSGPAARELGCQGQRLALFPRQLVGFTGVYPGMAVGIVGEPYQRDAQGVLTGVLLWDLVLPHRPVLPWRVDRPIPLGKAAVERPTRVQFCCGPFPRADLTGLLRAVTSQALFRGADVLIIGGPLVKPYEDEEKEKMSHMVETFENMLFSYVDTVEGCLNEYYASHPNIPHLKVVMVPHRDDVVQVPVLPEVSYALEDTGDIVFRSNPCRLSVNGVHFGVCNEDTVGVMRDVMVERWSTPEGSLRRVVETLVQSRWYTPIVELPVARVDMKYLHKMRLDHAPEEESLLDPEGSLPQQNGKASGIAQAKAEFPGAEYEDNWNVYFSLGVGDAGLNGGPIPGDPQPSKRAKPETEFVVKTEDNKPSGETASSLLPSPPAASLGLGVVEYMPHVIFAPSTRPQFAVVTHQGVCDFARGVVQDESALDDTATATGVLVVNQGVWSARVARQFTLRVAEVTIPNSALVVARGASVATGVTCGVLHIFSTEGT